MSEIQTARDYGQPNFKESCEGILGWQVRIYKEREMWAWYAHRHVGTAKWTLESDRAHWDTYEAAKADCIAVLESLPPEGWVATQYARAEDMMDEVGFIDGRWRSMRRGAYSAKPIHYETAHLAAAGHEHEEWA